MEILTSADWTDYELIDTGNMEKLERFGKNILIRPEPQAVWQKSLSENEWENCSHARYFRSKGKKPASDEGERGSWIRKPGMPDQWVIGYSYKQMKLKFRLGLTAFGHIGVFPEQAINWNYIYDLITQSSKIKDQNYKSNLKTENPQSQEQSIILDKPSGAKHTTSHVPRLTSYVPRPTSHVLRPTPRILNLFAYTGGASLAAKAAGADVGRGT